MTLLEVGIVNVPQPAPEHVVPVNSHVTPLLFVSLASVAVKVSDCPVSIIWVVPGIICTVIVVLLPPPHPATEIAATHASTANMDRDRHRARRVRATPIIFFLFTESPLIRAYVFEVVISPFRMAIRACPRRDERTPRQT